MSNYPFETFPLTKRVGLVNPVANLDARYGPWSSFNDALTGFSPVLRQIGLTVAVSSVGDLKEYWYKDGIADEDLILKSEIYAVSGNFVLDTDFDLYKTDVASATASNIDYVHSNFLPLTGGTISGATRINNNLTIWGDLSASGTTTFANTIFTTTSALSVVHVGSGPAMWVGNNGDGDIASFYDIDQNIEILHVGGINSSFPNVGVKTSNPNKEFTVNGEISANNTIYDATGNSTQWNTAYNVATIVQNTSSSWEESSDIIPTVTNYLSTNNVLVSSLNTKNAVIEFLDIKNSNTGISQQFASGNLLFKVGGKNVVSISNSGTITLGENSTSYGSAVLSTSFITSGTSIEYLFPNKTGIFALTNDLSSNLWNSVYTNVQTNSASWEESAEIIPTVTNYLSTNSVLVSSLNISDRFVLDNQLYYSTDSNTTQLCALSGNYDEGQFLGKIKLSQNNTRLVNIGNNWTIKSSDNNWGNVAMSSDGKYQTTLVYGGKIHISDDYGNTWNPKFIDNRWSDIAMSADGKYQTAVDAFVLGSTGLIYVSNDYGNTWTPKASSANWTSIAMSADGKYQTATIGNFSSGYTYISNDYGNTWTQKLFLSEWRCASMSSDGRYQIVTNRITNVVYISNDYGNTWNSVLVGSGFTSSAMSSDGKYQILISSTNGIYISGDYGNTWRLSFSTTSIFWSDIAVSSDGKYQTAISSTQSGVDGAIYISSDYGNTWTFQNIRFNWRDIAMSADGKYQTATVFGGKIYTSVADELIDGNLHLSNAAVLSGTTLTESISSLVLTINGQQYKVPLLPI